MSQKTHRKITYYALLSCLVMLGVWGLSRAFLSAEFGGTQTNNGSTSNDLGEFEALHSQQGTLNQAKHGTSTPTIVNESQTASDSLEVQQQIQHYLDNGHYDSLAQYINSHYSALSAEDLARIRQHYSTRAQYLKRTNKAKERQRLHQSQVAVFDDLDAWSSLADVSIELRDWPIAYDAALKTSHLENDTLKLEKVQFDLVKIAANLRAELESQKDEIGINQLYTTLHQAHPNYARYQLELAYSYLRLDQADKARPLLTQLQYDLELGEISQQVLAKLEQKSQRGTQAPIDQPRSGEINIPLQRSGTNLIAGVKINQRPLALLLDTGASITALDNRLIKRLGLQPTGQVIQLGTANGVRQASLYQVKRLQLGNFTLANHTVAGIDLGGTERFAGLLGTDILNRLNQRYSYVIDNQRQALIFKPKN